MSRTLACLDCGQLTRNGSRCRACGDRREALRGTSTHRGYDGEWRRTRAAFLATNPRCLLCGAPASDVDHVVARRRGGTNDWSNLRPLCHACHSRKTVLHDGGFGRLLEPKR